MGTFMVKFPASRARIAALILGCVGLALAVSSVAVSAQSLSGPTSLEAPSDALARYMRTLAASPRSFDALIGAGRAALALGDTQAAAGFFGRAEEVHSASPLPHIGMGAALLGDGDAIGSLSYFARASQLGANGAMIGKDRGLAYDLLGRHSDAQADYRAALYGPEADEARRRLALSLAITGDKDGALGQLAPLIARGDAAGQRCRALVLALSGDVVSARRSVDAVMPGAAARMEPFLRGLTGLSSSQKAAAVNLGMFPNSPGTAIAGGSSGGASAAPVAPMTGGRLASIDQLLAARTAQSSPVVVAPPVAAPGPVAAPAAVATRVATATPPPATPAAASRIWLQLASGDNAGALPDQFRRMKSRHREVFDGVSGYVAEGPDRARLLIGPFKSKSEADIFAEDLASLSVRAFSWTNPAGQPIRKLGPE